MFSCALVCIDAFRSQNLPTANTYDLIPSGRRSSVRCVVIVLLCSGNKWYFMASSSNSLHCVSSRISGSVSTHVIKNSRQTNGKRTWLISWNEKHYRVKKRRKIRLINRCTDIWIFTSALGLASLTSAMCCFRSAISCFSQFNTATNTFSSEQIFNWLLEIKSFTWNMKSEN